MREVLTSFKPAWHIRRIEQLREGKDIVPTHLQLIISDLCNQDCHFCAYRMEGGFSTELFGENGNHNPKRFIPTSKVAEILQDAEQEGVRAVEFTGGGEPTVHPEWQFILNFAQSIGLECGLVTNGTRLDQNWAVLAGLKWLRVSLDAGTELTYSTIRRSRLWDKVLRNIERAAKIRGPLFGVGFVITRENYLEIVDACVLCKKLGVPYVRLSAMFSHRGAEYYEGLEEPIREMIRVAKYLEDDTFTVVDFFGARVSDLEMAAPDYQFCGYQQFVTYIGGDQKIYTCCTNAYTRHGEIGDLRKMSFSQWLASTPRYDYDARKCHHCQFNDKNKLINYLLDESPPHVNFV